MKVSKKLLLENPDKTIREVFPELFINPTGWYKHKYNSHHKWLMHYDSKTDKKCGFNVIGEWQNYFDNDYYIQKYCVKATHKEVKTALIKEAERRGLISDKPINYKLPNGIGYSRCSSKEELIFKDNKLWLGYFNIFDNGTWAEIIETISKEEAEKILNKKIV